MSALRRVAGNRGVQAHGFPVRLIRDGPPSMCDVGFHDPELLITELIHCRNPAALV